MKIKSIKFKNASYIYCKSKFYSAHVVMDGRREYEFCAGVNKLYGEIDSDIWGVSYLLSMYKNSKKRDMVILENSHLIVNEKNMPLQEILKYSCYMDEEYSLFASKKTIRKLVEQGIKENRMTETADDVRSLFHIDEDRFERPISGVGNELFRVMAAIGYCNNKQIYCFPWLSKKRFEQYHKNITDVLEILESLDMIAIVPIGE